MECSCKLFDAGCDEFSEIHSAKWITSKSAHKCTECDKSLKTGTEYYRERTKFDGIFETFKTCKDCMSIRKNLCGDWVYGEIREMVSYAITDGVEIPEKCIAALTAGAREWVCDLIEKEWERDE